MLLVHRYPKYGEASRLGKELLQTVIDESFQKQSVNTILRSGKLCQDTRGSLYRKYFGPDTKLSEAPSGIVSEDSGTYDLKEESRIAGPKTFVVAARKVRKKASSSATSWPTKATQRGNEPSILTASLLRTYDKPTGHSGLEPTPGTSSIKMWEACEATSAAPVFWGRTRARRQSVQKDADDEDNVLHLADGGMVANNPTRHALQEAAMLFPGRPLGLVLSVGLGRHARVKSDEYSDDIAKQVEEAGGKYVRLDPIINDSMNPLTSDHTILQTVENEVRHYMATSDEARKAKLLIDECLEQNPAIRGRYAPACKDRQCRVVIPSLFHQRRKEEEQQSQGDDVTCTSVVVKMNGGRKLQKADTIMTLRRCNNLQNEEMEGNSLKATIKMMTAATCHNHHRFLVSSKIWYCIFCSIVLHFAFL